MIEVTIIIPIYNRSSLVNRVFESIKQFINNKQYEIIIIDDNGSDNTYQLIKNKIKSKKTLNIKLIKNIINKGPAFSRNIGIKNSRGEYIAFLDSDDGWHNDKIKIQVELMKKNKFLFSGTGSKIINENDFLVTRRSKINTADINYSLIKWTNILFKSPFITSSVILHKDLKKYLFNENLRYGEDYNLWKRISLDIPPVKIELELAYTFKHPYISDTNSLSNDLFMMQKNHIKSFLIMYKENNCNLWGKFLIVFAIFYSFLKFIRRVIIKFIISLYKKKRK